MALTENEWNLLTALISERYDSTIRVLKLAHETGATTEVKDNLLDMLFELSILKGKAETYQGSIKSPFSDPIRFGEDEN